MDRESLRPLVEAQYGESRITVLSEETINAELDDALEGITDDAQVDDAFTKRIASRLLRMNGNVAKEAGTQITNWKQKHPIPQPKEDVKPEPTPQPTEDPKLKAMEDEIAALKQSLKEKDEKEANDAAKSKVRAKFYEKYKELGITPKEYFVNQVFSKFQLPTLSEGESYDIDSLQKTFDANYTSELKAAGIDIEKPRKGTFGKSDKPDAAALKKREEFKARMRSKGKLPQESAE